MIRVLQRAIVLAACTGTAALAAQQPIPLAYDISPLFASINAGTPGCAVGVRSEGRVVNREAYGSADLERGVPITPTSVFYTGSVSKQFTAMSIALAARDGAIGLDDPVRKWIPELPDVARDITIRQLVHHTGGLREKWDLLSMQGVPVATTLITQQMVLDLVARQRGVNFPAGTRHAYNNTGYDLLATIIQRATGKSIRQFAQERIFGPLRMTTALYADKYGELIRNRVMGYSGTNGQLTLAPAMVETVGSGSVYASLDDLLKWVESWEHGVLADTGLQRQLETPGKLSDGTALTYAWGLVVDQWRGTRRVQHGGALVGYRTAVWRLPDLKWSAVVLCNSAEALPDQKIAEIAALYFPRQLVEPTISIGTNAREDVNVVTRSTARVPEDIVGTYWSDELQVTWTIEKRDTSYMLKRGRVPEQPVRMTWGDVLMAGGWRLEVERDASGKIAALLVGAGRSSGVRFERVDGEASRPQGTR